VQAMTTDPIEDLGIGCICRRYTRGDHGNGLPDDDPDVFLVVPRVLKDADTIGGVGDELIADEKRPARQAPLATRRLDGQGLATMRAQSRWRCGSCWLDCSRGDDNGGRSRRYCALARAVR
jgi:hypothetical protein